MPVAETAALIPYKALTIEDGTPPAFTVCFAHDEAVVFPYRHLYGVGWLKGDGGHQIFVEHRFCKLYIHGNHLEPLLAAFERLITRTVHVFEPERHAAISAEATVVTHIDDHYENESGKTVKLPSKR
jgi:hypothetical protein